MYDVKKLLGAMLRNNISDIHLKAGSVPLVRVNGDLSAASDEKLSADTMRKIVETILSQEQAEKFRKECDIDFAYSVEGLSRFRVNASMERGNPSMVLRVVPTGVKSFEELNLPDEVFRKLANVSRGLILVAGITGSGKTTTLNAVINHINETKRAKIVMIEDPIEYYHFDKESSISQREIGRDAKSFESALRYSLRQDPDIIVIGELRDSEAMKAAILAAETGHLVLSTIHTIDTSQTIDRIVSSYPPHLQSGVCAQLAYVIKGIVAQRLVPAKDGSMQYPICEILIGTSLVKNIIVEKRLGDIPKALEQGTFYGMRTFDQDLYSLCTEGKISSEIAFENATNVDDLSLRLKGIERTS